jgi:hypothetical protein
MLFNIQTPFLDQISCCVHTMPVANPTTSEFRYNYNYNASVVECKFVSSEETYVKYICSRNYF